MSFTLNRAKGQRMWGGGSNTFNGGRSGGGGGSGAGGGGGVSSSWVDENYVSKDYFNQLFKVKVAVRVLVTDPSTTPATVVSDTTTPRQELLYPNEVPEPTETTDEETGYVTSTTYPIDSIQVMGGLWTNSYLSALGQNSSGGGGGGGGSTSLYGLLDVNIPAALTQDNDGQVLMYNFAQNKWINATIQQSGGTVTSITAGTGLSGGTITSSGTIAIDSTYQTYISHGETAYGWGNHANAGYATQQWVTNQNFLTQSDGDGRYLKIDFFRSLFRAYNSGGTEVQPNNGDTSTIDNIKAMFGFWTNAYISALGQNSSGGGGGGGSSTLAGLSDVALDPDPLTPANANDVLSYNGNGHWVNVSKASFLSGYVTTSDISDMATQTWVLGRGYITGISSTDVTTALGYTPLNSATTFWGQSVNNGVVNGSMTSVGNITFDGSEARRISPNGTALFIGNSDNTNWVYMADMASQSGDSYWKIYASGYAHFKRIYLDANVYMEYNSTTGGVYLVGAGFYTDSFVSALGLNSSGGGGGSSTLQGLLDVNIPATLTQDNDGQVLMYNYAQKKWINATIQQSGGTVTSITAGTGLSGGIITTSGTIAINSTYQTYISHGETAYGWGNHADAGYLTASAISDMATKTWVGLQGYTTNVGTVTSITAGTGLSGGTITGSGTIAIDSTYQTYISHGETAYGWGNHAGVGYWESSNHPTTLSGYGITDAVNSSTTWWGQSVSNGVVSGSLTNVGNITSNANGSIYSFSAIEFGTASNSGNGGALYFHFPGVFGHASSYIIEQSEGVLSLLGTPPTGGNFGVVVGNANGTYLQIGGIRLVYDSTNNALKVQKSDGTAANLYATGGVSALGMSAGTSAVDAMTFNYVTINNELRLKNGTYTGSVFVDSNHNLSLSSPSGVIATLGSTLYTKGGGIDTEDGDINAGGGTIITTGDVKATRFYLDATRYLYVSSGTLYYYNGTSSKQVAFTN